MFVGPSGCGKTTSMRMINRMIEPTLGHAHRRRRGRRPSVDPVKLRLGIGYVIQSGGLMPHQRVVDNVATVPVLKGQSRRSSPQGRLRGAGARRPGSRSSATAIPAQLSGGQQQRVGVARALAADPPILLMDEPFSAVDPVVRDELQAEILRLQSELRKTIVFVTHDIDEAVKLGDRVAVFGPAACCSSTTHRRGCCRTRPTISSPDSSAPTAATVACSSARPTDCHCTTSRRSPRPRSTRLHSAAR